MIPAFQQAGSAQLLWQQFALQVRCGLIFPACSIIPHAASWWRLDGASHSFIQREIGHQNPGSIEIVIPYCPILCMQRAAQHIDSFVRNAPQLFTKARPPEHATSVLGCPFASLPQGLRRETMAAMCPVLAWVPMQALRHLPACAQCPSAPLHSTRALK